MTTPNDVKQAELRRAALEYHEFPTPGKVAIAPSWDWATSARWQPSR